MLILLFFRMLWSRIGVPYHLKNRNISRELFRYRHASVRMERPPDWKGRPSVLRILRKSGTPIGSAVWYRATLRVRSARNQGNLARKSAPRGLCMRTRSRLPAPRRPKDRNISRLFDQYPADKATRSIDRNLQHRKIDVTLNIH
jgi:hypothetical protein